MSYFSVQPGSPSPGPHRSVPPANSCVLLRPPQERRFRFNRSLGSHSLKMGDRKANEVELRVLVRDLESLEEVLLEEVHEEERRDGN